MKWVVTGLCTLYMIILLGVSCSIDSSTNCPTEPSQQEEPIAPQERALRIDATEERAVRVSCQYYHRNSTTENYVPYYYSSDPYDDVNGTVVFKLTEKGQSYSAEGVDFTYFRYQPDGNSRLVCSTEADNEKLKPAKYYYENANVIAIEPNEKRVSYLFDSYLFSNNASEAGDLEFTRANYAYEDYYYVSREDELYNTYCSDYAGNYKHMTFDGIDYPSFQIDADNRLTEGTFINVLDYYWLEIITVKIEVGNVEINWPDYLWGIDHFN